jgi:hypothetical protein
MTRLVSKRRPRGLSFVKLRGSSLHELHASGASPFDRHVEILHLDDRVEQTSPPRRLIARAIGPLFPVSCIRLIR